MNSKETLLLDNCTISDAVMLKEFKPVLKFYNVLFMVFLSFHFLSTCMHEHRSRGGGQRGRQLLKNMKLLYA